MPKQTVNHSFLSKSPKKNLFFCAVTICLVVEQPLIAQKSTARFLYWKPAAASSALGGVGAAYLKDAYATFFNPAALAFGPALSASGSFVKPLPFFGNEANSFFAFSARLEDLGTFGLSTGLYWRGKQARTENDPTIIETFEPMHWQAKISYGFHLAEQISAGAGFSVLRMNYSPFGSGIERGKGTKTTVLVDLGLFANSLFRKATWTAPSSIDETLFSEWADQRVHEGISVGLSFINIGPKISFVDQTQEDTPPTTLLLGATYYPLTSDVAGAMVAIELEKRLYDEAALDYIHLGAELMMLRVVALRVGYYQAGSGKLSSFSTLGAGVVLKYFSLNIARYSQTILPTWHYDGTFSLEF